MARPNPVIDDREGHTKATAEAYRRRKCQAPGQFRRDDVYARWAVIFHVLSCQLRANSRALAQLAIVADADGNGREARTDVAASKDGPLNTGTQVQTVARPESP